MWICVRIVSKDNDYNTNPHVLYKGFEGTKYGAIRSLYEGKTKTVLRKRGRFVFAKRSEESGRDKGLETGYENSFLQKLHHEAGVWRENVPG